VATPPWHRFLCLSTLLLLCCRWVNYDHNASVVAYVRSLYSRKHIGHLFIPLNLTHKSILHRAGGKYYSYEYFHTEIDITLKSLLNEPRIPHKEEWHYLGRRTVSCRHLTSPISLMQMGTNDGLDSFNHSLQSLPVFVLACCTTCWDVFRNYAFLLLWRCWQ